MPFCILLWESNLSVSICDSAMYLFRRVPATVDYYLTFDSPPITLPPPSVSLGFILASVPWPVLV